MLLGLVMLAGLVSVTMDSYGKIALQLTLSHSPMTIFNQQRLTNATFKLDVDRMRRGWYSDKYFENIGAMLRELAAAGYTYSGQAPRLGGRPYPAWICTRLPPATCTWKCSGLRAGRAPRWWSAWIRPLEMLRQCAGYFEGDPVYATPGTQLEVEAVHDGAMVKY